MKQKTRRKLQNAGVILLIALGFGWIISQLARFTSSTYTDNAQIHQRIVPVNSRVQGFVKEIRFDDYLPVHKGDTLALIEDTGYRLQLAQARANLQNALSGKNAATTAVTTTNNDMTVTEAALTEVQALLDNARRDLERYHALLQQDAVTRQQFDDAETHYLTLKAKQEMLTRQKNSTGLTAQQQFHRVEQNDATLEATRAAVELAELHLSYTVITAPCNGTVSRRDIHPGQLIQPGQTLVSIVDTDDTWVIANYRETQTARMHPGDHITIRVDALPGISFRGFIETISNATGAKYSPIPQDNATGNFVKVEQRIPVKIRLAPDTPAPEKARLKAGMNVECKITD